MKKILLLNALLAISYPSGHLAAAGGGDLDEEIKRIAAPLINRGNAERVIDSLLRIPEADPATRLLTDNRGNADLVLEALRQVPEAERATLVGLITDPETRLVCNNRYNVYAVICALREVPAAERRDRVIRARNHMDLPPGHAGFHQRLRQLLETPLDAPIPPLGGGMAAAGDEFLARQLQQGLNGLEDGGFGAAGGGGAEAPLRKEVASKERPEDD